MMDTKRTLLALAFFFPLVLNAQSALRLWYEQPASASVPDSPNGWKDDSEWLKALPLGNGALGAMVFGDQ